MGVSLQRTPYYPPHRESSSAPHRAKKKSSNASRWEAKVRQFLGKVGFEDVDGGEGFKFGNSSQIDACGGTGRCLVIVDAHSPSEFRRKSVRTKIKELRGERPLILRGLRRSRKYRKYRDIRLIV